jgi:ABC-type transport system involved in multi-copper enzyme maturation permease subunit
MAEPLHRPAPAGVWAVPSRGPRRPLITLFWCQLRCVAGSLRFAASAVLVVGLMLLAAGAARSRYRSEELQQEAAAAAYTESLAGATVSRLADTLHPAVKRPWRLSFAADGGQQPTPNVLRQALSPEAPPIEIGRIGGDAFRIPGNQPLDWMLVVRLVLSLAAVLLGYDAICGERQPGTLKLLLSYPVPRSRILAGKFAALWSCLAIPFVVGAAASLLMVAAPGGIPLSREDLEKAGLLVLFALWASAFFVLASLLVSSLSRHAATSLSVLAWLWVTAVIVAPAVSGLLARRLLPIPSEGAVMEQMKTIDQRIARQFAGQLGNWRRPRWAAADGFAWERASAAAEDRRQDLQDEVRGQVVAKKIAQARLARRLASVSPVALAADLAETLIGCGPQRDESFFAQARAFRAVLAARVRALDAADPASPHILFFSDYMSQRPVAAGAAPRFRFAERPLAEDVAEARQGLALFALETAALALVCLLVFARLDGGYP